ncbi:unnamed protein product [Hyaloperonospora brassicae]|uniref:FYVE-type domain-containing protein n=1 Tax=Hyaloperonospora brassicae TaxID=162125 RepID=A0AAV0SYF6_HYABA|nr:unnamed protein product [Hyaloperonospora brassicae]
MKFTLPKDTLNAVKLSHASQQALVEEAASVASEMLAANELFLAEKASTLDPQHWKHVRTKDGVHAFRQRQKSVNQQQATEDSTCSPLLQSPMWGGRERHVMSRYRTASETDSEVGSDRQVSAFTPSGIVEDSVMEKMRPSGVPMIALHGTIDGSLDDCLFGCFAPTDADWKLRCVHNNERLSDTRVLAVVQKPTADNPFQSLSVKWFTKEHPVVLSGVVQQRDFLIIEAMGFTRDPRGEQVGYFLLHSVALRSVPELTHLGIVRGVMSFCHIFRQGGLGQVDVFSRGFFDCRGALPGRVSISLLAEAALSCTNVVDLAYMKKLRWFMAKRGNHHHHHQQQHHLCHREREDRPRPSRCEACSSHFSKILLCAPGSGTKCQMCYSVVCTKCIVAKKIALDVPDTGAVQQGTFNFCLNCFMAAKQQSSSDVLRSSVASSSLKRATISSPTSMPRPRFVSQNALYTLDGHLHASRSSDARSALQVQKDAMNASLAKVPATLYKSRRGLNDHATIPHRAKGSRGLGNSFA